MKNTLTQTNCDLRRHFQQVLTNCGCDIELAFDECSELKLFVKRNPHLRALHPPNL